MSIVVDAPVGSNPVAKPMVNKALKVVLHQIASNCFLIALEVYEHTYLEDAQDMHQPEYHVY